MTRALRKGCWSLICENQNCQRSQSTPRAQENQPMRASQLDDDLYDPDPDDDFDAPIPMRPIRMQYLTTTRDKSIQTDMLERLGLAYVYVGVNLFALNECDTTSIRLTATELVMLDGVAEPTEDQVTDRVEQLLAQLVIEQGLAARRSALHEPSVVVQKAAQDLRAQADAILAARGVEIRANVMHAIAEHEAA